MKITKEQAEFLENFLHETGFEIWNGGCTHRLSCNWSTEGFRICEAHDPLRPVKTYKTAQGAINFMIKEDES